MIGFLSQVLIINMPLVMDIDKFLKRDDYMLLAVAEWPWEITHFILRKKCFACGFNTDSSLPSHITVHKKNISVLLYIKCFWCLGCNIMTIYDHYLSDECNYCNYSYDN